MTIKEAVKNLYQARDAIDALLEAYEKKEQGSTQRTAKKAVKRFVAPSLKEWIEYAKSLEPYYDPLDAEGAWNYYESVGWKVGGKAPMKNWKASCRQCHQRYIRDRPGVTTRNDASISSLRTRLKAFQDRHQGPHTSFWQFLSPAEVEECKQVIAKIKELEGK